MFTKRIRFNAPALTKALALCALFLSTLVATEFGVAPMIRSQAYALATLPAGFSETQVAGGLASPTAMEFAPDGRLFVCEQAGALRVISSSGALLAQPFVTLNVNSSGERGLLGVAFDPNFASNQFVYVYYTVATSPFHNRVSRFTANGNVAAGGETEILNLNNLSATNHNGGALHFGPDGKLYVAAGENAVGSNAQSLSNLLGKMLRINSDGSIPDDNPFYSSTVGDNRAIWAYGLRNPFTFAFQRTTGRMFINDVGQNTWEEINDGIAGSNYGWPQTEGPTSAAGVRSPTFAYTHSSGCAIAGGAFYNPLVEQFPAGFVGDYFFADYCGGWIRRFHPSTGTDEGFATGISFPVDLKVSSDGSLYYLARGSGINTGVVFKILSSSSAASIGVHPADQTATVGDSATFSVEAHGTPPLSYQWRQNGLDISGATSSSYTVASAQLSDDGALFRCIVTNAFGSATSNAARLTVVDNQQPTATITQPTAGVLYSGGQTINFAGTGTDPEQGNLSAAAFTWRIDFHHDAHTHPAMQPRSGIASGTFVVPTTGETSDNVFYRIYLTVTDGSLPHEVYRDVMPRKATVTIATSPSGLQVTLDDQPMVAPVSFVGVVGIIRRIGTSSPQTQSGRQYTFKSWSDRGAQTHSIVTPAVNTTFTARFLKQK